MKHVVHTIPSIAEVSSGPSYSVVRLCDGLVARGLPLTLAALDSPGHRPVPAYTRLFPRGIGPARLGRSVPMKRWLEQEAKAGRIGILHNHSFWMLPNIYPGFVASRYRIPYVVAPRGTLAQAALDRGSRLKRVVWPLLQRPSLAGTTIFHATAESEREDIRRCGFRQPIAVIPNGVDIPRLSRPEADTRTVLYLGRIHPSKGIDLLLHAWARLAPSRPGWQLRLVGPDNGGYLAKMRQLAEELALPRTRFDGALEGDAKADAYSSASVYVLPTHSENFGLTVAEALAAGTPAIVTKGAPWSGLAEQRCGWWIDLSVDAVHDAMAQATSIDAAERAAMGLRGRAWMEREFGWESLTDRVIKTYDWILGGMSRSGTPSWVDSMEDARR